MFDVVIVGGGPAGLSAALMLGRCRRRTLICDAGRPRNARSRALHGFLTRDGVAPLDLVAAGRAEVEAYGVEWRHEAVRDVVRRPAGSFDIELADRTCVEARAVLLATGVVDEVPNVPGADECYGRSLFHCPYCDGWEVRDQRLAVYGRGSKGAGLALALKNWSAEVVLLTDGSTRLSSRDRQRLARNQVVLRAERVRRFEHDDGQVRAAVLDGEERIECSAVFFNTGQHQRSDLAVRLGCEFNRRGAVKTDLIGGTCVPGLYVAGDASRDVQFVIVAAAEGAKVAYAINTTLQIEATG